MLGDKYSGKKRSKFPLQDTDKEMQMWEKFSAQKNWSTTCILKLSKGHDIIHEMIVLFVFVALRPMSTAMVIAGRSVHLTTLFPGQA